MSVIPTATQGSSAAPNQSVDQQGHGGVKDREERQVWDVGVEADEREHRPVDHDRDRQPVLVEGPEQVLYRDRAIGDDPPLVGEER